VRGMTRWLFVFVVLAAAWFAPAQPAHALGCILGGCDCNVTAADIEFEDINPLTSTSHSADGQIDIYCTGLLSIGAGVIVQLDDGQWGTFTARRMRSDDGDYLDYNIYKPNQPTVVWGDNTGGSQQLQVSGGLINIGAWSASRPVHATLTVSSTTKPGDYEDNVVVRVIW
jgi:spore coat protein U-like protein